jgi:holo-[acyl-carrier protein] synthase
MLIGVDITDIRTLRAAVERSGERFLRRVFTPAELEYCRCQGPGELHSLAGRFAAKEATIKALNIDDDPFACADIEVWRDGPSPRLRLHRRAAAVATRRNISKLSLSISHDGDYAVAFVVAEDH